MTAEETAAAEATSAANSPPIVVSVDDNGGDTRTRPPCSDTTLAKVKPNKANATGQRSPASCYIYDKLKQILNFI